MGDERGGLPRAREDGLRSARLRWHGQSCPQLEPGARECQVHCQVHRTPKVARVVVSCGAGILVYEKAFLINSNNNKVGF